MLGGKALDDWQPVREAEMGHMLKSIFVQSCNKQTINVLELLSISTTNIFGQMILSKRVFEGQGDEASQFKDNIVELLALTGQFNIGDYIPSIAWMDLNRVQGTMKKIAKRFDDMLNKMIAEHKATTNKRATPDFLDVLMSKQKNFDCKEEQLSDDNIKGLLMDLFTAGTDTSSIVIEWALSELILNPKLLKHAQAEMDEVIGKDRHFQVSDIPKLPYLVAICKEVFRKHPPTPLGLPRVSTKACQVGGYYIPKGTRFTLNIWGIGRDPEIWDNPLEFNPNRFVGSKIDPSGGDFQLIPFGAGRRMCPGTRMGISIVEYNLGSLIHAFDWELPPGKNSLSMEETFGLALPKKEPLMARATPRLALHLY